MKILALDIAQNVGWACGDGSVKNTRYGVTTFAGMVDYGNLSWLFSEWLADTITDHSPDLMAIERGFFRGKSSYHLSGMIWDAHRVAWLRQVQRVEYPPTTIKKFICGTASAGKPEVMAAVEKRGFDVETDHEADALALLLLARERIPTRARAA